MSIGGSSSIRSLKDVAIVMGLHELAPVGRWAPGGCDRWRLERFAKMGQDLTSRGRSHPGLLLLANLRFEVSRLLPAVSWQPDVTTATGALERKLLPHPRDQFRPRNPRGVVRAGLLSPADPAAAAGPRAEARRLTSGSKILVPLCRMGLFFAGATRPNRRVRARLTHLSSRRRDCGGYGESICPMDGGERGGLGLGRCVDQCRSPARSD